MDRDVCLKGCRLPPYFWRGPYRYTFEDLWGLSLHWRSFIDIKLDNIQNILSDEETAILKSFVTNQCTESSPRKCCTMVGFSLLMKNICDPASRITHDYRPLPARAGLPHLPPRCVWCFASNCRSSSCAFPNSHSRIHVFFQHTLK